MDITEQLTTNCWPNANKPGKIVIHHWDDPAKKPTLQGVVNHFCNPRSQVSSHYVVSGNKVVRMVQEQDSAWHCKAGNNSSIGIEIDPNTPDGTYEAVGKLVRDIRNRHGNLPLVRHRDVPSNSTTCPGDIDLNKIEQYAQEEDMPTIKTFDEANLTYWTGEHRNFYEGRVTKEEVEGRVGLDVFKVLDQMKDHPNWLYQNYCVLVLPNKFAELQQQITALEQSNKVSDLVQIKEQIKQVIDELEKLSK